MITAILPAHDEAESLPATVASLRGQTVQPDRILVVSDNSTDDTVEVARSLGVEVMETVGNQGRKAGALNQALAGIDTDLVLVMDADTVIVPTWIEDALAELVDPSVGGVGAVFRADRSDTWLTRCQMLEWERFAAEVASARHTFVLSGTAALIRVEALEDVRARFGTYYREDNITEDFMFSVDLLACGWELRSPDTCRSITETMPTVRDLYRQRRRWFQGALQTVTTHGLHRHTLCYWHQQVSIALGVIAFWAAWIITAVTTAAHGLYIHPWFAFVGLCFWGERVATAVRGHRLFAALLLPELAYAIVLQFTFTASVFAHFTGRTATWHHITKERVSCS